MNDDSTRNDSNDYDTVTAADIASFAHHLADLRRGPPHGDDPAERAVFLARKADLLIRIAEQHTHTDPGYASHVLQLARDAHAAAEQATLELPLPRVGPTHRRTRIRHTPSDGARSKENSGASSG